MKNILAISLFAAFVFLFSTGNGIAAIQDTTNKHHTETQGKAYKVSAVVKKIFRDEMKIVLKHKKINGVMAAMTMTYPVSKVSIFNDIEVGCRRTFTVFVYKGTITVIGVKKKVKVL